MGEFRADADSSEEGVVPVVRGLNANEWSIDNARDEKADVLCCSVYEGKEKRKEEED
jgi:hypothetical protein